MKLFRFLCVFSLLFMSATPLFSHPHVFIQAEVQLEFDAEGLNGVRINWAMDDMISTGLIFDYDRNFNSQFEPEEMAVLREEMFGSLKEMNYFTFINVGEQVCKIDNLDAFMASIQDFKVQYSYFVPCRVKAEGVKKHAQISMYDPSFYNYIELQPENVKVVAEGTIKYKIESFQNPNVDFYKKQFIPQQFDIEFEKK